MLPNPTCRELDQFAAGCLVADMLDEALGNYLGWDVYRHS